mmetsp:Transcript_171217/g.548923  ORF Transcript_171217/g.548923 Transcript_171217/m.548923 type:complete len:98 (+) Transcript_171217:154-447(+)
MSVDAKGDGGSASSGHLSPKAQVRLVYFLVVLYAVCYQLQSPLEPFLVDSLVGKEKKLGVYGVLCAIAVLLRGHSDGWLAVDRQSARPLGGPRGLRH